MQTIGSQIANDRLSMPNLSSAERLIDSRQASGRMVGVGIDATNVHRLQGSRAYGIAAISGLANEIK